jgi:hypothetical protein
MEKTTIRQAIIKGVRSHIFLENNMGGEPMGRNDYLTTARVAIQIAHECGIAGDWTATEVRAFLEECGIDGELLDWIVLEEVGGDDWYVY